MVDVATCEGDGFRGWPERGPFDAIVVTAGAHEVPAPLLALLAPGCSLVMPIGPSTVQERLEVVRKGSDGAVARCAPGPASFVPPTGEGRTPPRLRGLTDRRLPPCCAGPVT